jgi:hypothetical protein
MEGSGNLIMTTAKSLEFCAHLARAIRNGVKKTTWKPLSIADQRRRASGLTPESVPYPIGSRPRMFEPWGTLNGGVVYVSSFCADTQNGQYDKPVGFQPGQGLKSEVSLYIVSCDLRKLQTITEQEAEEAGMVTTGNTHREEFIRQWQGQYRGALAWEADPFCWLISFQISS